MFFKSFAEIMKLASYLSVAAFFSTTSMLNNLKNIIISLTSYRILYYLYKSRKSAFLDEPFQRYLGSNIAQNWWISYDGKFDWL